jgi:hypothetical protein
MEMDDDGQANEKTVDGRIARFFLPQTYQNGEKYTK